MLTHLHSRWFICFPKLRFSDQRKTPQWQTGLCPNNEACNAHEEIRRRRAKEVSFSDLALHEERQLYTLDKYFQDEEAEPSYQQAGKKITPKLLLEAIRTLPEEKRKAIMLYYFEGMTDVEIGKLFNTSRSTIQYRRTSSFEILKKYLEEHADEWDEW